MKKDRISAKGKLPPPSVTVLLILYTLSPFLSKVEGAIEIQNDIIKLQIVPEKGGRVLQYKLGDYSFFWVNGKLVNSTPPETGLGPNSSTQLLLKPVLVLTVSGSIMGGKSSGRLPRAGTTTGNGLALPMPPSTAEHMQRISFQTAAGRWASA
jgi:hypothetical protein